MCVSLEFSKTFRLEFCSYYNSSTFNLVQYWTIPTPHAASCLHIIPTFLNLDEQCLTYKHIQTVCQYYISQSCLYAGMEPEVLG